MRFDDKRLTLWLKMINLVNNIIRLLLLVVVSLLYTSCFTGVESTQKITEKDVKRAVERFDNNHEHSIRAYVDSLPSWREGKGFWVLDNQVRYLFTPSFDFDIDSLDLEGEMLTYAGYEIRRHIDNTEVVDVLLRYGSHVLRYATGKPIEDVSRSAFSIPFMVDDDMLKSVSQQLVGKTVYVKTPAWYDLAGNELSGCPHYVPVEILGVKPGNKLHPLRVEFRADNGNEALLWMKIPGTTGAGRDFDSQFSMADVRKQYPHISSSTWSSIVACKVAEGMTKEECRLALGNPVSVQQLPDQSGLREYWYYDGGKTLFFVDGLLKEYR